jgi:hypothetical protein
MRTRPVIRHAAHRGAGATLGRAARQTLVAAAFLPLATPASAFHGIVDDFETGQYAYSCYSTCTTLSFVSVLHALGDRRVATLEAGPGGFCGVLLFNTAADDELRITGTDWKVTLLWLPHPNADMTDGGTRDRFHIRLSTTDPLVVTVDVRSSDTDPGGAWSVPATGDVEIPFWRLTAQGADLTNVAKVYVTIDPAVASEQVDTKIWDIRTMRAAAGFLLWDVISDLFNWCPTCPPEFASVEASTGGVLATFEAHERIESVTPTDPVTNIRVDCFDGGDVGVAGPSYGRAVTWQGGPYSASTFEFATDLAQVRTTIPTLASPPTLIAVDSSTVAMEYVIRLEDTNTGALLGNCVDTVFWDVYPGQGLRFDDVSVTPIEPALAGEVTGGVLLSFALEPTGPVDTALPLVTSMTVADWAEGAAPTAVARPTERARLPGLSAVPSITRSGTRLVLANPRPIPGTLSVFDAAGRLVRRLEVGAGTTVVPWDGRAQSGAPLPAGVYFASLPASGGPLTTRVVLLR